MTTVLTLDVVTLLLRAVTITMFLILSAEITFANHNQVLLSRLRDVWLATSLIFLFPLSVALDSYMDISPGFALKTVAERSLWAAYVFLLCCLIRLWVALRTYRRGK